MKTKRYFNNKRKHYFALGGGTNLSNIALGSGGAGGTVGMQGAGGIVNTLSGVQKLTSSIGLGSGGLGGMLGGGMGGVANGIATGLNNLMNPNGNETGIGNALSAVGSLASNIPGVGGIIGAGVNLVGGVINSAFGSNINEEFVKDTENKAQQQAHYDFSASDNSGLLANYANYRNQRNVTKDEVGSEGWFSNAATNKTKELNALINEANRDARASFTNTALNLDEANDRRAASNYFDRGGDLNNNFYGSNTITPIVDFGAINDAVDTNFKGRKRIYPLKRMEDGSARNIRDLLPEGKGYDILYGASEVFTPLGTIMGISDVSSDLDNMVRNPNLTKDDWVDLGLDALGILPSYKGIRRLGNIIKDKTGRNLIRIADDLYKGTTKKGNKELKKDIENIKSTVNDISKSSLDAALERDIKDAAKSSFINRERAKGVNSKLDAISEAINPNIHLYNGIQTFGTYGDGLNDALGIWEAGEGLMNEYKDGGGIHIKKKNRGKFTAYCGGKVTSECIARGKRSSSPTIRKRATFAANARKWKHDDGGNLVLMTDAIQDYRPPMMVDSNNNIIDFNRKYGELTEQARERRKETNSAIMESLGILHPVFGLANMAFQYSNDSNYPNSGNIVTDVFTLLPSSKAISKGIKGVSKIFPRTSKVYKRLGEEAEFAGKANKSELLNELKKELKSSKIKLDNDDTSFIPSLIKKADEAATYGNSGWSTYEGILPYLKGSDMLNTVSNHSEEITDNLFNNGGFLSNTHGGVFSNGVIQINEGGTHSENPFEGVQMGVDNQGIPNLVEEGEVVWNDYVFSNRLKPSKEMKKKNKYKGTTFADIAKNIQKESEERPNDWISNNGLEAGLSKLAALQEGIRERKAGNKFDKGGKLNPYSNYTTLTDDSFYTPEYMNFWNWINNNRSDSRAQRWLNRINSEEFGTVGGNIFNFDDIVRLAHDYKKGPVHNAFALAAREFANSDDNPNNNRNNLRFTPDNWELLPEDLEELRGIKLDSPKLDSPKTDNTTDTVDTSWEYSPLRYAPIVGNGLAVLSDIFSKPDYSAANMIADVPINPAITKYNPVGEYLTYRPLDRNYYTNQLRSNAAANRRAIMNTSGGNRAAAMAGLLASDYNFGNQLGQLARQAEEYNNAQRERVAAFNRETDLANSRMGLQTNTFNAESRNQATARRLAQTETVARMRQAARDAYDTRRSTNLNNLLTDLAGLGTEITNRRWLDSLAKSGVLAIDSNGNFIGRKNSKGGKLRKKGGWKYA